MANTTSKNGTAPSTPNGPTGSRPRSDHFAQSFSQVISVLARDPELRKLTIGALETVVLPPVLLGHFAIAHSRTSKTGGLMPVAVAMWAKVAENADVQLSDVRNKIIPLKPEEWNSGDNLWITLVGGDRSAISKLLKKLQETEFAGKTVKIRKRSADGSAEIAMLADIT